MSPTEVNTSTRLETNETYVARYYHGTVIRTGIKCKKIFCYMRDSASRWFIVKNVKIFISYVKHFRIFPCKKYSRVLIGFWK